MNNRVSLMLSAVLALAACHGETEGSKPKLAEARNHPPAISSAELSAGPYYRSSPITVTPKGWTDPDGDAPEYSYQWYVNGKPVDGATKAAFTPNGLVKYDRIRVSVTPTDGLLAGQSVDSVVTTFMGSRPEVYSVGLVDGPYFAQSTLTADVWSEDRDGDPVAYRYEWFVNGDLVVGATGKTLAAGFKRTDHVFVRVTPYVPSGPVELSPQQLDEDLETGLPADSNEVAIFNTPPEPPSVAVYPTTVTSGSEIWASVETPSYDIDGDAVFYTYEWYKNGELMYSSSFTNVSGEYVQGGDSWVVFVTPSDNLDEGFAALAYGPIALFSNGERIGGAYHTCVRPMLTNVLRCWGRNDKGQLGDGTINTQTGQVVVSPVVASTDIISKVALGYYHTCVLLNAGAAGVVRCWGANDNGQLGIGSFSSLVSSPTTVIGLAGGVKDLVAGGSHTCAIKNDDSVYCWGENLIGQLGNNSTADSHTPVLAVAAAIGASTLATSDSDTCIVVKFGANAGKVQCWGDVTNNHIPGSPNNPQKVPYTITTPVTFKTTGGSLAVSGNGVCAVASSNTDAYCWGEAMLTPAVMLSNVSSLTAGMSHFCALTTTFGVKCWGGNQNAQLGDGTRKNSLTPVAVVGFTSNTKVVAAGALHTCAITGTPAGTGGRMFCWGDNAYGQLGNQIPQDVVATPVNTVPWAMSIDAGDGSSCLVTDGGGAKCWGDNSKGQLGDGTITNRNAPVAVLASAGVPLANVVSVAVGHFHACVLRENGSPACWGKGSQGQLGNGLTADQTYPVTPAGTYSMLAAGDAHTCGITTAGDVNCWGDNTYGQLGQNDRTQRNTPTPVNLAGKKALSIAAGLGHTCVGTTNDEVWCWGANWSGQLGDGTTTQRLIPVKSSTPAGQAAWRLSTHDSHTCAQFKNKDTYCWGNNATGQLGLGDTSDRSTPTLVSAGVGAGIATGYDHTCMLTTAGAVYCWGRNTDGEVGDGTTIMRKSPTAVPVLSAGVVAIAGGGSHTCVLLAGGNVKCWGRNNAGQVGNKTTGPSYSTNRLLPLDIHTGATALGAGSNHTCDVIGSGVTCWGLNEQGQLGDSTNANRMTPVALTYAANPNMLDGGKDHTCALFIGNVVWCWGGSTYGQLGIGNTTAYNYPVGAGMAEWANIEAIPSGKCLTLNVTSIQIKTCANLWADANQMWYPESYATNGYIQFHSATDWNKCINVNGNTGMVNGTALVSGPCSYQEAQLFYSNWTNAAYAGQTTQAVELRWQAATTAQCWDVIGGGTADNTGLQIWTCNGNAQQLFRVISTRPGAAMGAGDYHNCAVSEGTKGLKCWGRNDSGQLGLGNTNPAYAPSWVSSFGGRAESFSTIIAGNTHTCARVAAGNAHAGAIRCWGGNGTGQLGLNDVAQRAIPTRTSFVLQSETTGIGSAGNAMTCLAKSGGGLRCFGEGTLGQVGQNQESDRFVPTTVSDPYTTAFNWWQQGSPYPTPGAWTSNITKVVSGSSHQCAIADGHAFCWGNDSEGQISVGGNACSPWSTGGNTDHWSTVCARTPTLVIKADSNIGTVTDIATKDAHTCAIFAGQVFCWGRNNVGQLGRNVANAWDRLWFKMVLDSNAALCIKATGMSNGNDLQANACNEADNTFAWSLDAVGGLHPRNNWSKAVYAFVSCFICGSAAAEIQDYDPSSDFARKQWRMEQMSPAPGTTTWTQFHARDSEGGGTTRCLQNNGSGSTVTPVNCSLIANQEWRWQPFVNQRVGGYTDASQIAVGHDFSCVLRTTNAIYCWGLGDRGQMGDTTIVASRLTPSAAVSASWGAGTINNIVASYWAACALIGNPGTVWCWGGNASGELGDGSTTNRSSPVQVKSGLGGNLTNVISISAGFDHFCAIQSNGRSFCWGSGNSDRMGANDGNGGAHPLATAIAGYGPRIYTAAGQKTVDGGGAHSCFISEDRLLYCAGANDRGQLGIGATGGNYSASQFVSGLVNVSSVATGDRHTCVIEANPGPIKCFGANDQGQLGNNALTDANTPQVVNGGFSFTKVVAGANHTCGILSDTSVKCWGRNLNGQLGTNSVVQAITPQTVVINAGGTPLNAVVELAAGQSHTCARTSGGAVKCWGGNSSGQVGDGVGGGSVSLPADVRDSASPAISSMSLGQSHGCAVRAGAAYCWGDNSLGQLGDVGFGPSTSGIMMPVPGLSSGVSLVKVGANHSCALMTDGKVKCWGDNALGQVGAGTNGLPVYSAFDVALGGTASDIALGTMHTCAAMTAGGVKCWGANDLGQLGNNSTVMSDEPVSVSSLSGAVADLAAGGYHTCAVTGGAVKCWGFNYFGQLGTNNTTSSLVPVSAVAPADTGVTRIEAGDSHTCAIKGAAAYCWGSDEYGQVGNNAAYGSTVLLPSAVSGLGSGVNNLTVNANHACVSTATNQVYCWGSNYSGQLGGGVGTLYATPIQIVNAGAVDVATGYATTCYLDQEGHLQCWGERTAGQIPMWSPWPVLVEY